MSHNCGNSFYNLDFLNNNSLRDPLPFEYKKSASVAQCTALRRWRGRRKEEVVNQGTDHRKSTPPYIKKDLRTDNKSDSSWKSVSIRFRPRELRKLNFVVNLLGARGYRDAIMRLCSEQEDSSRNVALWDLRRQLWLDSVELTRIVSKSRAFTSDEVRSVMDVVSRFSVLATSAEALLLEDKDDNKDPILKSLP